MSVRVEIVRAWPRRHESQSLLLLPDGATVGDALAASGWEDADCAGVAVFGLRATPDQRLCDGDRVEVLRSLQADPKDARRRRAAGRAG